jgi:hypothetical protein
VEEALTYLELMLQRKLQPDAMLFDILRPGRIELQMPSVAACLHGFR